MSVTRGKVNLSGNATLSATTDIHKLNSGEVYKYLWFFRLMVLTAETAKSIYTKRLLLIWNSLLSGPCKI